MASGPLLVVDVQRGFVNEFTEHIPDRVRRLIDTGDFAPVLYTLFINTPGSPYQKLLNWHASVHASSNCMVSRWILSGR